MKMKIDILYICLLSFSISFPISDLIENNLPNCTMSSHMFSGYLDVEPGIKELFYLFVESEDRFNTDPLMIYFSGGPGCTSMLGAFVLHGPCVVDDDTYFHDNPYSWN